MAKDLPVRRNYGKTNSSDLINDWINTAESLARNAGYNTAGRFSSVRTVTKSVTEVTDMLPTEPRNERTSTRSDTRVVTNFPNYDERYRNSSDKLTQDINQSTSGNSGVIKTTGSTLSSARGKPSDDSDEIQYDPRREQNGKTRGANSSLSSNLSLIPTSLEDINTQFASPLSSALDPNRNRLQKLINDTMAKVDPNLGAAIAVGYAAANNSTGLNQITKRSGAVGTLTGILTGKLDPVSATQKIRQLTYPERRQLSTSVNNITKPFSEITRDLSRAIADPIGAVGKATGKDVRAIKLGAGIAKELGVLGSSAQSAPGQIQRNYNTEFTGQNPEFNQADGPLSDPRIQNVIGSKNAALVQAGATTSENPVDNLNVLGKSLTSNNDLDSSKVKTYNNREIQTLTGGEFDEARSKIREIEAQTEQELDTLTKGSDNKQQSALTASGQPKKSGRDGSVKFGNQLRKYNSYNYIITLGILNAKEFNFPSTLEKQGFTQIVAKSAGGQLEKRVQTIEEAALGGDAEYFLEELEIDVVIAPSQNTGVGVGTNVSFQIIEPYSMGKFLEALKLASEELGYSNFSRVPFCLRIDFVGYDHNGNAVGDSAKIKPRFFPIIINNIEFEISGSGSTYAVSAVAYSDVPHSDLVNEIKTDISSVGIRVHQVLENAEHSIARNINTHVEILEDQKRIAGYDRTIIVFPKDKTSLVKALEGQGVSQEELQVVEQTEDERIRLGVNEAVASGDRRTAVVTKNTINSAPPKIYKFLKAWTSNTNNVNEIGLSELVENTNSDAKAKHPDKRKRLDEQTQTDKPDAPAAGVPQKSRLFEYKQGTKVTEIIEDVVLTSKYGLEAPEEERDDGKKKWFKIETMTFIETDEETEASIGRPRMTYVYIVIPYYVDEAKFLSPKEAPKNTDNLKAIALKEYDYIYTGKNEDILDFNINFNNAFFQSVMGDLNQGNTGPANSTKGTDPKEEQSLSTTKSETNKEQGASVYLTPRLDRILPKGSPSSPENEVKRRIAEQFHDRLINSEVDMITAQMQIWGDPFYIPLDNGNHREESAGINATQGGSVDYTYHEVTCNINFLTPLDYPNKPGHFVMDFPELVRPFSGFFQVLAVTNSFSNGKFTQELKLVRRPRQTDKETGTAGATTSKESNFYEDAALRELRKEQLPGGGRGDGSAEVEARKQEAERVRREATQQQFNEQTQIGGA